MNCSTNREVADDEELSLLMEVFKPCFLESVSVETEDGDTAALEPVESRSLGRNASTDMQGTLFSAQKKNKDHLVKMIGVVTQGSDENTVLSSYRGFAGARAGAGALWAAGSIWSVPDSITSYRPPQKPAPPKMKPREAGNTCAVLFWGW